MSLLTMASQRTSGWRSPIDPSHRCGHPQAACREPAGNYDKTTRAAICFEHKTQYLLIHAPYTRIVVFWHISNISSMISQSQISCNTPKKQQYLWNIAIKPAVGCYNSWANLRCSGCVPLGEKWLWNRSIEITWRGSVAMPSIPIHCKCMGGWFVLKSIAHGSKCAIELCLPIDVVWQFSWLMETCSEFTLHLPDAANQSLKLHMFTCKHQAWDLWRQSTSISLIIYQYFPSRNLCDLTSRCC